MISRPPGPPPAARAPVPPASLASIYFSLFNQPPAFRRSLLPAGPGSASERARRPAAGRIDERHARSGRDPGSHRREKPRPAGLKGSRVGKASVYGAGGGGLDDRPGSERVRTGSRLIPAMNGDPGGRPPPRLRELSSPSGRTGGDQAAPIPPAGNLLKREFPPAGSRGQPVLTHAVRSRETCRPLLPRPCQPGGRRIDASHPAAVT